MRYWAGALSLSGLVLAMATGVHAQSSQTGPTQTDATSPGAEIEVVTVTARRRAENLERVPINVTALSADELRSAEIKSATDLATVAPTLTVAGNLGSRDTDVFTIRGQGQPFGGADPGVQSYFAEVPFNPSSVGTYYDLANVQVLSGPQGTLFGRSTTGGAILFEPQRPENDFGGYIDGQYGNYNFRELTGALNVPIVDDTLLVRAAFDTASRDGFTKDTVSNGTSSSVLDQDNLNYYSFRFGVTWRPFSHFENYAMFDYIHDYNDGTGDVLTGIGTEAQLQQIAKLQGANPALVALFYPFFQSALTQSQAQGPRETSSDFAPFFRRKTWQGIDIARYDVTPDLYVRNIFGYLSDKQQPAYDFAGTSIQVGGLSLPILDISNPRVWESDSVQVTDELQVGGQTGDKSINWIAGFYHELDRPGGYSEVEREVFGGDDTLPGLSSTEIQSLANGGTSNAIYGSATYNASSWADGLSLTAGGRYTWDHKVATNLSCVVSAMIPSCPFPLTNAFREPTLDGNFKAPDWTLSANYQVTDDTMVYATYRRGYKSGGFNSGVDPAAGVSEFKPEFLTDVEVGSKNNWTILAVPGRTNFDAYYGWYDDVQKNDLIDVGNELSAVTLNAARANIKGVDFQSTIIPDDHVDFNLFYSYTDATYGAFSLPDAIDSAVPSELLVHTGNPFAYTPANKYGVTTNLHFIIERDLGLPVFSVTWYAQSRVWFTDLADLEPDGSQGAYYLVNMRLDWNNFMNSPADLAMFVNNVGNRLYKVGGNPIEHLTGTDSSIFAPPRMFGIELRYRFGADANAG